jgi:hypothetical protein
VGGKYSTHARGTEKQDVNNHEGRYLGLGGCGLDSSGERGSCVHGDEPRVP